MQFLKVQIKFLNCDDVDRIRCILNFAFNSRSKMDNQHQHVCNHKVSNFSILRFSFEIKLFFFAVKSFQGWFRQIYKSSALGKGQHFMINSNHFNLNNFISLSGLEVSDSDNFSLLVLKSNKERWRHTGSVFHAYTDVSNKTNGLL